jgi:DNA primase
VGNIEDVRVSKRRRVIDRAKNILSTMIEEITPDSIEITEEVKEAIRLQEIVEYGKEALPAGPNIKESDAVIVVEGRADVLNLLRHGIKNAIGVEGTSVPKTIADLSKEKTMTVFTDGDRGGELILRELLQMAEVDFVAKAPEGKEVEELTKKEIFKSLRNKIPAEQVLGSLRKKELKMPAKRKPRAPAPQPPKTPKKDEKAEKFRKLFIDLTGSLKAYLLDNKANVIKEVAVRDLAVALKNSKEKVSAVIFDGVITQRLMEIASEKGVEYLVGAKVGNITKKPAELRLFTAADLGVS